jgi:hypothetical protein
VLGRTLDELPPKTRDLLRRLGVWVAEQCAALALSRADFRFSRRAVREATRWSDTPLKVHLGRLAEMEYLLVHRGGRGQSFEYELLYRGEGEEGAAFLMGLIDVARLDYDGNRSGQNEPGSGSGPPSVRGRSGGGPGAEIARSARPSEDLGEIDTKERENALLRRSRESAPYRTHSASLAASAVGSLTAPAAD